MPIDNHAEQFLAAVKGIAGHHIIAAMDVATVGVNWRHCGKRHMADDYAKVMGGERFSLSPTANDGMARLDLAALRRAALERASGNPRWAEHYAPREVNMSADNTPCPTPTAAMLEAVAILQSKMPRRQFWCGVDPKTGAESSPFAVINGKGMKRAIAEGLHVFTFEALQKAPPA
jgi:hypothetical protein